MRTDRWHACRAATVALLVALAGSCASRSPSGAPRPASPPVVPTVSPVQALYEAGRYGEVVSRVAAAAPASADAEAVWLAAHSHVRLGRNAEAVTLLSRLAESAADPAWQVTARLGLAAVQGDAAAAAGARQAATAFPDDPFVQYELGLALARGNDFAAAAQAFDRTIEAHPRFAYAHYYGGLAYQRIGRADLMAVRMEAFIRLAPDAPERPEVEAILRTVRGR